MTIRRKTTVCGRDELYKDIELFEVPPPVKRVRRPRFRESLPKQKKLNDRHAKEMFARLVKTNFRKQDLFGTLTYEDATHPKTAEDVERDFRNFNRKLKRRLGKGVKLKWVAVVEMSDKGRFHVHFLIKIVKGLTRELIEECWDKGWSEAKPVCENRERNVDRLAKYMTKNMSGTRRWMSSRGLERPKVSVSDGSVSRKKFHELSLFKEDGVQCREYWARMYQGYEVIGYENFTNPEYGTVYIRVKLRRLDNESERRKAKTKKHQEHPV